MRFTRTEIARARALKERGLTWKPGLGHWYATVDGFTSFIRGQGEALHVAARHFWLPQWVDCRRWLGEHGYTHPEFPRDEEGQIRIEVVGPDGAVIAGTGATDLECLYELMARVLDKLG